MKRNIKGIIFFALILLVLIIVLISRKSLASEILDKLESVIINSENSDYFSENTMKSLTEFKYEMKKNGYVNPEISYFETPEENKIYYLIKSSCQNSEDKSISYIIFELSNDKVIDVTVSNWVRISPEKKNF